MGGMRGIGKYSGLVHGAIMCAESLELTDSQKKELEAVREKFLYPMVKKEADFRISHMKIVDMMHDAEFDPAKLKAEIKVANGIELELANMAVDAAVAIRNAVGIDNFKKITGMMPKMQRGMMRGMMGGNPPDMSEGDEGKD
jgi:uncharacterized protein YnzC (UPF0291/DUF896 family)